MKEEYLYTDANGFPYYRVENENNTVKDHALEIFVVFGTRTTDFPGRYVLRRNVARPGRVDIDKRPLLVTDDIEAIHRLIPPGKYKMGSDPDPNIIEVWL